MIELDEFPTLVDPVIIAAFEGWNDAGDSASGAIAHLREVWDAEPLADLDSEDYYDYQVNRPHISIDETGVRSLTWPATRIYIARVPLFPRDIVLVQGVEPNMKWQQFVREMLGLAAELEVSLVITLGALLSDIPHTRPVPVTGTTATPQLALDLDLEPSTYEGPTGIVGILQDACGRFGIPPSRCGRRSRTTSPSPRARRPRSRWSGGSRTSSTCPCRWATSSTKLVPGRTASTNWPRRTRRSPSTCGNSRRPATPPNLPEASGEAIAREFERYLRRRGADDR